MPSVHSLQRGLHGYLIRIAPHAFVLEVSAMFQQTAFAIGVLVDISAFYYYTDNSVCLSHAQVWKFSWQLHR